MVASMPMAINMGRTRGQYAVKKHPLDYGRVPLHGMGRTRGQYAVKKHPLDYGGLFMVLGRILPI